MRDGKSPPPPWGGHPRPWGSGPPPLPFSHVMNSWIMMMLIFLSYYFCFHSSVYLYYFDFVNLAVFPYHSDF